jgi:hypothetical protein
VALELQRGYDAGIAARVARGLSDLARWVRLAPPVGEIIKAKDQGVFLPRTVVYTELADAMHRGVQKIMLSNTDIKSTLDQVAAEVDRASAAYRKG